MTIIQEIAEETRREMLQCQRAAIRSGAQYYAKRRNTRFDCLWKLRITPSDTTLQDLKNQLRALMHARKSGSWRYSHARYIAVMQCIGGELILARQSIETLEAVE